jgi:protein involved in polysaccharide export with SLBB domain
MTSQDLIMLAGGLTENAIDTNGEITRYGIDKNRQREVTHLEINFNQPPQQLQAGDTMQVKQIALWKAKENVRVTGEVIFPGTYSIIPGETLTQVLARAGGFTPHAYPTGSVFSRAGLRSLEKKRLQELKKRLQEEIIASNDENQSQTPINDEEADKLLKDLDSVKPAGRMVIDLPNILANPKSNDFQMENGDEINIPRYKPSVTVVGEVQFPTSHFYQPSLDVSEYIDRSGGFKKHADNDRVYIVKANGSVIQPGASAWFKANSLNIQAGDTIIVPLETDKIDALDVWSKVTTIVYQAALGAAAVKGF